MQHLNKLFLTILLLIISINSTAQIYKTDKGFVQFYSEATVESFIGESKFLNGEINLDSNKVDFYLDLTTLKTGIDLRDEHMRENHLETGKFPFAEFTGVLSGFNPSVADSQSDTVNGDFTIHGVTKTMTIKGKMIQRGFNLVVFAQWYIKLDDYNIDRPQFLFLKLAEEQKITLKANLARQ